MLYYFTTAHTLLQLTGKQTAGVDMTLLIVKFEINSNYIF